MRRMATVAGSKTVKLVSGCIKRIPLTSSTKKFTGHMVEPTGVVEVVMN